jgi:hypothetical protein
MANLELIITESTEQIVANIPKTITLDTNVPATIFYTLDSSVPTTSSNIYISPIKLSEDQLTWDLKAFATNGIETTDIISKTYHPNLIEGRNPFDAVSNEECGDNFSSFPFGSRNSGVPITFGNTAKSIATVDNLDIVGIADGYDGSATNTIKVETDLPLTAYKIKFSETDVEGNYGHGIGTLPAKFKLKIQQAIPLQSNMYDRLFNPKAFVMYQDFEKESTNINPKIINRALFSLDKSVIQENYLQTSKEGAGPTGRMLVPFVDYKNKTILYSYFDSFSNRWIFSKEKFTMKDPNAGAMYNVVYPRGEGARYVMRSYFGIYHKSF